MEITREKAEKVLSVVDAGLVSGLGNQVPGEMCVEAAVCYAFDLPHGDKPTCVGSSVRSYAIRLNDANWPTEKDRTEGMRKLSIAQLGSDSIDQKKFTRLVIEGAQRKMVPIALRTAAKKNPEFADALEAAAVKCETAPADELRQVVIDARELAYKVRKAYAAAAAYADAAAAADADAAAAAAAYAAAAYADADADAAAAAAAAAYAAAAAAYAAAYAAAAYADAAAYAAAAYADADADADAAAAAAYADAYAARLEILNAACQIGVDALIECGSPGCEFLDLCESK